MKAAKANVIATIRPGPGSASCPGVGCYRLVRHTTAAVLVNNAATTAKAQTHSLTNATVISHSPSPGKHSPDVPAVITRPAMIVNPVTTANTIVTTAHTVLIRLRSTIAEPKPTSRDPRTDTLVNVHYPSPVS